MEVPGVFFQCYNNRLWGHPSEEIDLTLRLGLPNHHKTSQEAPQGGITPQNYIDMNIPRYYSQVLENGGIQNVGGNDNVRLWENFNHRPWPLMQHNHLTIPSTVLQGADQKKCKSCGTKETPLWRKGPDGPRTLCNGCGLRYSRALKKQ